MSDQLTCQKVRGLLFELRRGELSDLKRTAVQEHIHNCSDCREMAVKTAGLVDTASEAGADAFADIDDEQLFERIESRLESIQTGQGSPGEDQRLDSLLEAARQAPGETYAAVDAEGTFDAIADRIGEDSGDSLPQIEDEASPQPRTDDFEESEIPRDTDAPRRWGRFAVAAAAAVAAMVAGWMLFTQIDEPSSVGESTDEVAVDTDGVDDTERITDSEGDYALDLTQLQRAGLGEDAVRLYAHRDTRYTMTGSQENDDVDLQEGSLLAEVTPRASKGFSVHTGSHTVTAVGTVFAVSASEGEIRVGVFDGRVRITGPEGGTHLLNGGEFFVDDQTRQLSEADYDLVASYIDLQAHRQQWQTAHQMALVASERQISDAIDTAGGDADGAARRVDDPPEEFAQAEQPDQTDRDEPDQRSVRQLHEAALEALHQQQPQRASELLTRALNRADPDDRSRADILLELARIHLQELDQPRQAATYLNQFVEQWPDDPAADAVVD